MASTTIADYQVIRDGVLELDVGFNDVGDFTFVVPSDIHLGTSSRRKAILNFNLRPVEDAKLTVKFNGVNLMTERFFSASHTRMHQETFDIGTALQATANMPSNAVVQFIVNAGKIRFSDIVFWYQINR